MSSNFKAELDDAVAVAKSVGKTDPVVTLADSTVLSCQNILADCVAKATELANDAPIVGSQLDLAQDALNNIYSKTGFQQQKDSAKEKYNIIVSNSKSFTVNVKDINDEISDINGLMPKDYDRSNLQACEVAAISANKSLTVIQPKSAKVTQLYKLSCLLIAKINECVSFILDIDDSVNGESSVRSKNKAAAIAEWNKVGEQIKKAKEQQELFDLYRTSAEKSPYSLFLEKCLVNLSSTKALPSISSMQHQSKQPENLSSIAALAWALKSRINELCSKIYSGYFNNWESMTPEDADLVASLSGGSVEKGRILKYKETKTQKESGTIQAPFITTLTPTLSAGALSRATSQFGKLGNSLSGEKIPPNSAKIVFTGDYKGIATLYLNNVEIGKCPNEMIVSPGTHLISFIADAAHTAYTFNSQTIQAVDGETYKVNVTPINVNAYQKDLPKEESAKVTVKANGNVETYVDGVLKGTGEISLSLNPGNYTFSFEKVSIDSYIEKYEILNVTLKQGDDVIINPKVVSSKSAIDFQDKKPVVENRTPLASTRNIAIAFGVVGLIALVMKSKEDK